MSESSLSPAAEVVVYWRPGCPYCSMLFTGLRDTGLPYRQVNIWDEPEGASFVRSVADGNEVVPTVRVGPVAAVNPSPAQVVAMVREHAPQLLPAG